MKAVRKIPPSEWEEHMETIKTLYVTQNKRLNDVVTIMGDMHGFHASKAQYIRKLKQLGVEKNSTNDKWKYIARQLEKRTLEGKDSEIYLNGSLIPKKKVRKEVSRYAVPSSQQITMSAPSPAPPDGVEICSPGQHNVEAATSSPRLLDPAPNPLPLDDIESPSGLASNNTQSEPFKIHTNAVRSIEYLHIPWFEFELAAESQFDHIQNTALELSATVLPDLELLSMEFNNWYMDHMVVGAFARVDPSLTICDPLWKSHASAKFTTSASIQGADTLSPRLEILSLFANILGSNVPPRDPNYVSDVIRQLNKVLVERLEGQFIKNIGNLFRSSLPDASFQLICYAIYLSSNNLLKGKDTDHLLEWITRRHQFPVIQQIVQMKTPTTEIFASNLLVSAARIGDVATACALVNLGTDINTTIIAGVYNEVTPLIAAIQSRDVPMVDALLLARANPNRTMGFDPWESAPVQEAMSGVNSREIVQMLLRAGADANTAPNNYFPWTLLLYATIHKDLELIEILLAAKADVNLMTGSSMTALQGAADINSLEIARVLLDAGADIDAPAGSRYESARREALERESIGQLVSPIQCAAGHNNTQMVQELLDLGAEVDGYVPDDEKEIIRIKEIILERLFLGDDTDKINTEDIDTEDIFLSTPLQLAVRHANGPLARLLLGAGAKVDGCGFRPTPLQVAAGQGNLPLVKILLGNGASINTAPAKVEGGRTALQAAAALGSRDLVLLLIDAGADLNAAPCPRFGLTALQAASSTNNIELVQELVALGADINAGPSPFQGRTCLQVAVEDASFQMVQTLLELGAEVNAAAAPSHGGTALQLAALKGTTLRGTALVDLLLNAGADVNAAPSRIKGMSALYAAVNSKSLAMVERLLLAGANPNGDSGGESPLVKATQIGDATIVQCLLQAGADPNHIQSHGSSSRTALQEAVYSGNIHIAHILLDAKADVKLLALSRADGPETLAQGQHRIEIFQLLLSNGAKPNASSSYQSTLGKELSKLPRGSEDSDIKFLINEGADVNGSYLQTTPLCIAARKEMLAHLQLLLDAGADVNRTGNDKSTALQEAAYTTNVDIIKVLLRAGAEVNAPASPWSGRTALQAAAKSGSLPITLLLLEAGADINAPRPYNRGRTALEAAAENGRLDIVSLLVKNDTDIEMLEMRCKRAAKFAAAKGNVVIARMLREYKAV